MRIQHIILILASVWTLHAEADTCTTKVRPFKIASKVVTTGETAPNTKELFEKELKSEPNLANSFRIVESSCGAGCSFIDILDLQTGKVWSTGLSIVSSDSLPNRERVESTRGSLCVQLIGCFDDGKQNCGVHKYRFNAKTKKLIPIKG